MMSTYTDTSDIQVKSSAEISREHWAMIIVGLLALVTSVTAWVGQLHSWMWIAYLVALISTVIYQRRDLTTTAVAHLWPAIGVGYVSIHTLAVISSVIYAMQSGWVRINDAIMLVPASTSSLVLILLATWALHRMYYYFARDIKDYQRNTQLLSYLSISTIVVATTYTGVQGSVVTAVICAMYFLLLDLFAEQPRASLLWLIVWTIILGSFLAFGMFAVERIWMDLYHVPMLDAFSLFSLIFVLSGLLYIPLAHLNGRYEFLPEQWHFRFENSSQLRNRVQLSILFTLLFSFVAIGVVSVYQLRVMAPAEIGVDIQRGFTQALLNTYVFLFLIGLVISMRLSEYIRTPLVALGLQLKDVQLVKENKQIQWEGSDEIADLIREYNAMISKLEDNAQLLAQSERDTAWREMSKQVAHEIKNPLTPMKLSLQHLQRSIQYDRDDIKEITLRMCDTLMNQVENLRQIADEFSNFGSLPKANNKKVLLNEIVETIHDLFRKREDMDIRLIEPIDDIHVYADKNQLVRILNNLVKNSVQAIPEDRKGLIELKLYKQGQNAIISVSDNGTGIPLEMQSQIFKPKFTTKSSGSGLGLAIAANMVDSIGGRIHFSSDGQSGTDFYLELPLVRSQEMIIDATRVML